MSDIEKTKQHSRPNLCKIGTIVLLGRTVKIRKTPQRMLIPQPNNPTSPSNGIVGSKGTNKIVTTTNLARQGMSMSILAQIPLYARDDYPTLYAKRIK